MGSDHVYVHGLIPTLRRNILPPSSRLTEILSYRLQRLPGYYPIKISDCREASNNYSRTETSTLTQQDDLKTRSFSNWRRKWQDRGQWRELQRKVTNTLDGSARRWVKMNS